MRTSATHILLADDDTDDCLFFKDALEELALSVTLTTVRDGVELMRHLSTQVLPDVIFLDLNMPRKNGYECLTEIKLNAKLATIPVVVYSTSFEPEVVDLLFEKGASHYIRKPGDFSRLKAVIHKAILAIQSAGKERGSREKFVIQLL
ncbi:MAG TPA: response regulator [Ohtaekwangia sp.]